MYLLNVVVIQVRIYQSIAMPLQVHLQTHILLLMRFGGRCCLLSSIILSKIFMSLSLMLVDNLGGIEQTVMVCGVQLWWYHFTQLCCQLGLLVSIY